MVTLTTVSLCVTMLFGIAHVTICEDEKPDIRLETVAQCDGMAAIVSGMLKVRLSHHTSEWWAAQPLWYCDQVEKAQHAGRQ